MLQAYNDWHIEEWCGTYPGRFIPLSLPPIWDPAAMADEVRRVAAKGCHAVSFSENPAKLKLPASTATTGTRSGRRAPTRARSCACTSVVVVARGDRADAPIDVLIGLQPVNIVQAAADLLWSPVLRKFPDLRVSLSEGGIGWIPYFLDRMDWIYTRHHGWTGQDFGDRCSRARCSPSRSSPASSTTPPGSSSCATGWASTPSAGRPTTPHSDSTWPPRPEMFMKSARRACPTRRSRSMTYKNAMRHYRFDPFAVRPRSSARWGPAGPGPPTWTWRRRRLGAQHDRKLVMASDLTGRRGLDR